jgi:RNA-directed DNA polymerase
MLGATSLPGNGRDAANDASPEADGERGEDAAGSVWDEAIDFLVYTIARCYSPKTGKEYLGTKPAKERLARLCREISELTTPRWRFIDTEEQVGRINRKLDGWVNYFRLGPVSKAYRAVDRHTASRLRRWLRRKHKVQGQGTARYPDEYLYQELKLVRLQERTRNFAWAKP